MIKLILILRSQSINLGAMLKRPNIKQNLKKFLKIARKNEFLNLFYTFDAKVFKFKNKKQNLKLKHKKDLCGQKKKRRPLKRDNALL